VNVLATRVRLTARGPVVATFQHPSLGEAIGSTRLPLISISRTQNATKCSLLRSLAISIKELYPKHGQFYLNSTMGRIMVTLSDDLENRLREHLRKQGDLSRIVTEALESYLDRIEKKVKKWDSVNWSAMTNERWLKWVIARYYRSHGFRVSVKPVRVGNAAVDSIAIGPEGERIAIEVKSPRDDIVRGVGQCCEALAAGYGRAVLVTTLRVARNEAGWG
jgi:hypothetical protein